ncbi:MAG: hypothetical protein NTW86_27355 [Candidatus Sumerlaeota bacterium]|nr:hypothetical protein [Candidatus Sumerlaeota bacterium]
MKVSGDGAEIYSPGARWARRLALALALAAVAGAIVVGVWGVRRTLVAARVAAVYGMFQTLASSLTTYKTDTGAFLPWAITDSGPVLNQTFWGAHSGATFSYYVARDLTDPFSPTPGAPLRYWSNNTGWTLWSAGPDRQYDLRDPKVYAAPSADIQKALPLFLYDPSNGIVSPGDLAYYYRPAPGEDEP